MKILQICGSYSWGGLEMQTFIVSEALAKIGNEVILICPQNSQFEKEKIKHSTQLYTINYKKNFVYILHSFIRAFKHLKPDIIHCQLSKDLHFIVPALKYLRLTTPLVFTKRMTSKINKKDILHKLLYNRIDRIFAISEYVKTNMIATTPVKDKQIEVLYNGVNLEHFNPTLYNNEERLKFSINPNIILIGMIGRITPLKGHYEFINAAITIKKILNNNVKFILVGGAGFTEQDFYFQIKNYAIKKLGENNIILTGFTNDIPRFLSIIDILIFPSYEESFGNVVIEAMAMGVPVVASDSGALPEIIQHDTTGILVKPKDSQSIAESIIEYLFKKNKTEMICKNAFEYVKENHDLNLHIEKLQKSYLSLIKKTSLK
ncbi:MAG: glycosyltransferase family 4 protein [Bacteroidetes bacterium]|nr:glycosyltransferase family 4 protein [Bacteroidota bacterium]